jgi:hypothetical protein
VGGARRPEVGKPRSRPPRPVDETPEVRAGPGPGPARGTYPARGPARSGPHPPSDHGSEEARHVPQQARAGRRADPERQRVGSGVPRQRVTAEGLKKRRPRTACAPTELVSSIAQKLTTTSVQGIKSTNGAGRQHATKDGGKPTDRTRRSLEDVARPPAARGWSLVSVADRFRATPPFYHTATRP